MSKVSVIGTTSWATTLAILLARNGAEVILHSRTEAEASSLQEHRENQRFLPGFPFPENMNVTANLEDIMTDAEVIVLAVPSQSFTTNVRSLVPGMEKQYIFVSATKGLESGTSMRMSEILSRDIPTRFVKGIAVLSGPNLSKEVVSGMPSATVVASQNEQIAGRVQQLFLSKYFRVYTNSDLIGVEFGGALKNILALGAGISDGLGFGDNGKSSLITRGLSEVNRLAVACGANPLTIYGIAGLGDVMATCTSPLSRNRYVGECIGRGQSLENVLSSMNNVAEGVYTVPEALNLASRFHVDMPITETIGRVLRGDISSEQSVSDLMTRVPNNE